MEIDPEYSEVYFNYGNLLFDEGDFQAAAARYVPCRRYTATMLYKLCPFHSSFEKAVEYPQMYSKTLNNLATTYFRLGMPHLLQWPQQAEIIPLSCVSVSVSVCSPLQVAGKKPRPDLWSH